MRKQTFYLLILTIAVLLLNSSSIYANSYGSPVLINSGSTGARANVSINNSGDMVWEQLSYIYFRDGKTGTVTKLGAGKDPSINDLGEIVWRNNDMAIVYRDTSGVKHTISKSYDCNMPDINNYGVIIYYDVDNGCVRTMNTSGEDLHTFATGTYSPSINDKYSNGQTYVSYSKPVTNGSSIYRERATGGGVYSYTVSGVNYDYSSINNFLDVTYVRNVANGYLYYESYGGTEIYLQYDATKPYMNDYGDIVYTNKSESEVYVYYNLSADRINLNWSGTGNYSNNLNWNYYIIPDETHQIHVSGGTLNLDSSREALNFEVQDGGVFNLGGYDYLINANSTIQSNGELMLSGGELDQDGSLTLTNNGAISGYGTINPAITNNGEISVSAGETLTMKGNVTGGGIYELNEGGKMTFEGDLTLGSTAEIHNTIDTYIDVYGDLINNSESPAGFVSENVELRVYNPITGTHEIVWEAADFGQNVAGLDDNFAIGSLVFGDDLGGGSTDLFNFSADSIIYCYGLSLLSDASLNLNGATIYYLNSGYTYNGITGTGFNELGTYANGNIYPIFSEGVIPEPTSLLLLGFGVVGIAVFNRKNYLKITGKKIN